MKFLRISIEWGKEPEPEPNGPLGEYSRADPSYQDPKPRMTGFMPNHEEN